jgi:putative ABC transport system ATP-binding protein
MIKITNLNKYYPIGKSKFHALKDINLNIDSGDMICIKGKSGAGKSTLLQIIGGLDSFYSGSYLFLGNEMGKLNDKKLSKIRNEKIGIVLQDFALINDQTVIFNTMLPMFFNKTHFSELKTKALGALQKVGIADQEDKKVNQLSGGQKQRVAIARALINDPVLLLADEPTGALDSNTSVEIMELIKGLNNSGLTVIIVSHDEMVAEYCNKTIYIKDGRMSESL